MVTNRYLHFFSTAHIRWGVAPCGLIILVFCGAAMRHYAPNSFFIIYMNIKTFTVLFNQQPKTSLDINFCLKRFIGLKTLTIPFPAFFFFTLRFAKCPTASQRNRYSPAHPTCYYGLQKSNLFSHVDFSLKVRQINVASDLRKQ